MGIFSFFEHVHPDKVLINKLQVSSANLDRIKSSSTSSYGGYKREKSKGKRCDAFCGCAMAELWQMTHFDFGRFVSHLNTYKMVII